MFQMWSPHVEICEDVKSTYGDMWRYVEICGVHMLRSRFNMWRHEIQMWRYVEVWSTHVKICGDVDHVEICEVNMWRCRVHMWRCEVN